MSLETEGLALLDRKTLLALMHDEIEGFLEAERAHQGTPGAGGQLYHNVSDIVAKVDGAGLDWRDVGCDKEWLIRRAMRHVLPFLDTFLDHAVALLHTGTSGTEVMRHAFAGRFRREIVLARQLGVTRGDLEKRIVRARNAGIWVATRVASG
jgi:hypothetical protein